MDTATTSVPRWPAQAASIDPLGRAFDIVAIGPSGGAAVTRWITQIDALGAGHTLTRSEQYDDAARAAVDARLADARIGWRLLVVAPEHEAMRVLAQARAAGALDCEVTIEVTDTSPRLVRCVHCARTSEAVSDTVVCPGCGRNLLVYHHFSRHLAAYFGYQSDAQDAS